MSTEIPINNEQPRNQSHIAEAVKKLFLVGIGTAVLVHEEGKAFANKMKEKKVSAETQGRTRLRQLHERRRQKAEEYLEKQAEFILQRLDIPTKTDYEVLSKKISDLSTKLDEKS